MFIYAQVVQNPYVALFLNDVIISFNSNKNYDAIVYSGVSINNGLVFNTAKCYIITFCRTRNPLCAQYFLGTTRLVRVNFVKNLGVIFDPHLNFHEHILVKALTTNCYRRLGFVIRIYLNTFFNLWAEYRKKWHHISHKNATPSDFFGDTNKTT